MVQIYFQNTPPTTHTTKRINNDSNQIKENFIKGGVSILTLGGAATGLEVINDRVFERNRLKKKYLFLLKPENKESLNKYKEMLKKYEDIFIQFDEERVKKIINDKKKFTEYLVKKDILKKWTPKKLLKNYAKNTAIIGSLGIVILGAVYAIGETFLFLNGIGKKKSTNLER